MNNAADAAEVNCDLSPLALADGVSLTDRLGEAPELHVAGGQARARFPAQTARIYVRR